MYKITAIIIATILIFGVVTISQLNPIVAAPAKKDITINTCKVLVDKQQCIITAKNIDDIRVGSIIVDVKGGYVGPAPTPGGNDSAAITQLQSDVQKLQSNQDGMNQAIDDIDSLNVKQNAQLDTHNQTLNILQQEVDQLKQTVAELKASSITDIGTINENNTSNGGDGNTTSSNQPSDNSTNNNNDNQTSSG